MKEFPLVVSYYTKDTLYQVEVQSLIASCEQWGLEYEVDPVASFGSWERNCCWKPFFLMEKLQKHRRPLLWVDADAVFFRKPDPETLQEDWDLAARINQYLEDSHPSKVNSGTVFVNATEGAAKVVKAWGQKCI